MPGLVPGIHVFLFTCSKTWMAGISPAMTINYVLPDSVKIALTPNAAAAANQIAARPSQ